MLVITSLSVPAHTEEYLSRYLQLTIVNEGQTPRQKQFQGSVPHSESGLAYMTPGRPFSSVYVSPIDIIAVYLPVE